MLDEAKTMSVSEAARMLGVSKNTAYGAARRGEIPCVRIGSRLLVLSDPLDRLLHGEKIDGPRNA